MKKRDFYEQQNRNPQADDLAKVRREKQRRRFWRRAVLLILAGAAVWGVLFLRKDIARLDLGMHFSDLLASYSGGEGYPLDLPAGHPLDTAPLGKDLALLTDTGLRVYNAQGKCTGSYEHGYTDPLLQTSGDRILLYDRGGKRFQVDSRSRQLYSGSTEYNISAADLSANGYLAVITGAKYFQNTVTVYDTDYDPIYIRDTADFLSGVCLENKADGMVLSSVEVNDGRLDTVLTFFDLNQEEPKNAAVIPGELALSMSFVGRGSDLLQVITDQSVLLMDREGKVLSRYDFDGLFVNRFVNDREGGVYLLMDQLGDGNRLQLTALALQDRRLVPLGTVALENRVQDMRLGEDRLYLYSSGRILSFSPDLEQSAEIPLEGCCAMQPAGRNLYGLTALTIERMEPEAFSD